MKICPTARNKNIVTQQLQKELLLYDLANNKVYCLNETSGLVWQLSDGKKSLTDISRLMREKLKTNVSEDLIWLALEQLKRNDLLANGAEFAINFGGLSRREVIRKVGLASMIAMPLIASVVAPSALSAQSGIVSLGSSCSPAVSVCQSGSCLSVLNNSLVSEPRCCFSGATNAPGFTIGCVLPALCSFAAPNCCSGATTSGSCSIPGNINCTCA
jgi:hypothetical protein